VQQVEYDYIIVGAGTAGCILASRISENEAVSVLLIEAGHFINNVSFILDPAQFRTAIGSKYDWKYEGRASGKILGGSSKINACIFMRGTTTDYDSWPDGWKYDDLLPYFKKSEDCNFLPDKIINNKNNRGFDGPIKLALAGEGGNNLHPYTKCFLEGCTELGYQFISDINVSCRNNEVALHQFNIFNKTRQSIDICYLKKRNNLTIKSNTSIAKIIINNSQAIGVTCYSGHYFKAKKEIILSAGAIGTPKILMCSGVGKKEELNALGITCIANLPVGKNFQDHIKSPMIFSSDEDISHLIPSCLDSGIQASLFTAHNNLHPNIQISFAINLLFFKHQNTQFFPRTNQNIPENGFAIFPALGIPDSRGHVELLSKNSFDLPIIKFNPYENENDRKTLLMAMKITRRIANSHAFKKFKIKEVIDQEIPYDMESDDYLLEYMKKYSFSQAHASCTCAIGEVVDEQLKVKGLKGLRIVDASIFPSIINANIQSTVIAIAEKASELIITE
jgi:choline dehydrogenase